jgi:monofunctional biosynthetic peptidoglycan transglycosylase
MSSGQRRGPVYRLLRAALIVVLVLLLLPYLLSPLYRLIDPPSTLTMWRRVTFAPVVQTWVPLAAISPALPRAVLVAEDGRFCSHWGVDFSELRAAYREADDLSEMRGGSTIAQQTVKNLFLWPGRSVVRKALEFPLALWFDLVVGKRRVMEIYLNIAEWGPNGQFGAEAGSRHAFGKTARDLSGREAARLAAILPNPVLRSAGKPSPAVRRLAGIYDGRARKSGAATHCIRR